MNADYVDRAIHKVIFIGVLSAGAVITWLVLDRDVRTEYHARVITTPVVKAGDYVGRKISVTRTRRCSVDPTAYITDVRGVRWHIDTPRQPTSGKVGARHDYVVYTPVPKAASAGPATLLIVLEQGCENPLHRFWPIVSTQSPLSFMITE